MPWTVQLWADHRGREPVTDYVQALRRSGDASAVATIERYTALLEENGPDQRRPR